MIYLRRITILLLLQFPVADGAVLGRDLGVRVLWEPSQQAEQQADSLAVDAVFAVGTRLWKEDAGPIPPRTSSSSSAADKGTRKGNSNNNNNSNVVSMCSVQTLL